MEVGMLERIEEENLIDDDEDEDGLVTSDDEESDADEDTESEISLTNNPIEDQKETYYGDQENPRCEQYVGENVDINIRSLNGNTSFHVMGRIKDVTPHQTNQRKKKCSRCLGVKLRLKTKKLY